MITKFFVGQTVYVAGLDKKTVSKSIVTGIVCETDVEGCGGPYDYGDSLNASWQMTYRIEGDPQRVRESRLFLNPREAFEAMERPDAPAA